MSRGQHCPEIVICVRTTLNWQDEAAVVAGMIERFKPRYEAWNSRFSIPYHLFRHRLKEIAQANLRRVTGVTIVEPDRVPPGALIVPVDDDDWFSPDLAAHLRAAYDPSKHGYYWPRYVLEALPERNPLRWLGLGGRLLRQGDHSVFTCGTNNYAVRNADGWGEHLASHSAASRFFDEHMPCVKRIPRMLSIQNRNYSSQTVLGVKAPMYSWRKLMRRFRRYRRLYQRVRLPEELAWAEPCVEQMAELMSELKPKC